MGHASARKATRQELRDAFGVDVTRLFDSHAASITDLVRALHHEVHMRVEHVKLVQDGLDVANRRIADLEAKIATWEHPQ